MKKLLCALILCNVVFAKILIQGAMPVEIDTLVAALKDKKELRYGSYIFYEGKIGGKEVVISRTLIGLINASAATAIGIEKFKPDFIINQGTAGAIVEGLEFGKIVFGEKLYNAGSYYTEKSKHSVDAFGKKPMIAPLTLLDKDKNDIKSEYFTSDEKLMQKFEALAKDVKIKRINIASADAFNREDMLLHHWSRLYGASAEEMESVAAAQVAKAYNVPYLSVRIISDNMIEDVPYDPSIAIKLQELIIKILPKMWFKLKNRGGKREKN